MHAGSELLQVEDLKMHFPITKGVVFQRKVGVVKAVDGISFSVRRGETLGLVGESGCGKSTLVRSLLQVYRPTSGKVMFDGVDLCKLDKKSLRGMRARMQMVFQDPGASLNPRMRVADLIAEPIDIHGRHRGPQRAKRVAELLELVGLMPSHAHRYVHEFSGGQRQRICIARALAMEPEFVVCDEPVSALDVSIQAQIINLLQDIQKRAGITYLFIAHDLAVVRHISDRVAVMYLGKIVEIADRAALYANPQHPYTKALLSAVPKPDPDAEAARERIILTGEVPSAVNPPSGCVFRTRCPLASEECAAQVPELRPAGDSQWVACIKVKAPESASIAVPVRASHSATNRPQQERFV